MGKWAFTVKDRENDLNMINIILILKIREL